MLVASYFVVAAALGLWLLPEFLADELDHREEER